MSAKIDCAKFALVLLSKLALVNWKRGWLVVAVSVAGPSRWSRLPLVVIEPPVEVEGEEEV